MTLHGNALNDTDAAQLSAIRDRHSTYRREGEWSEAAYYFRVNAGPDMSCMLGWHDRLATLLAERESEIDRLRAELLKTPPTLEWLREQFGEPDKPGATVSWWGKSLSWDINGQCNVGPYNNCKTMRTRADVLAAVKGA